MCIDTYLGFCDFPRLLFISFSDWGAQDVQNEFPDKGRQTAVPGGWMPGGVRDTSGDAGALRAPVRPRHRSHFGGG